MSAVPISITTSPINLSVIVSRTSGVAPLSVFFDCAGTTATGVSNGFTQLKYTWNFGDDDTALWAYGSEAGSGSILEKKNRALGPVAGHVYETAGTFTATLSVTDGTNTATKTFSITVTDPDAYYLTTNNICFFNTTLGTGAPAGATQVMTSDFDDAVNTYLTTGTRLLFKRGDTFTTSTPAKLNANGPWTIGAYGSGAKPIAQYASGAVEDIIQLGSASSNLSDGRVMDLQLDGNLGVTTIGLSGKGTLNQATFLRLDIINVLAGVSLDGLNIGTLVDVWDQFTVQDCTITIGIDASGGNGFFITATRSLILGNHVDNAGIGEHNFRSMLGDRQVVSNNTFTNPNVAGGQKANITIRNPPWYAGKSTIPANTYSQYQVVSQNECIGNSNTNAPVNTSIDSSVGIEGRTQYIILEANWLHGQSGLSGGDAFSLNSSYSSVRNNIIDLTDAGDHGMKCITISNNGGTLPNPTNNDVMDNTCFTNSAITGANVFRAINIAATSVNATIKNTLLYSPNATSAGTNSITVTNAGSGTVGASGTFGNSSNAQSKTNPLFTVTPPVDPVDYKITSTSYAINGGVSVPVFADFFGVTNPPVSGQWDAGAVNH